jgi:hypothetical protein
MLQAMLTKLAKLTFSIKHIKLSGWLHVLLSPLTSGLLVMLTLQYGLVNPTEIKMWYRETGENIERGQSTLLGVIDSYLVGVLVLPNKMVMPMDLGQYNFIETYCPPVRMVQLAAFRGHGFK